MIRGIRVLCLKILQDGPVEPIYSLRFSKRGWGVGPFEEDGLTVFCDPTLVRDGEGGEIDDSSTLSDCQSGVIIKRGYPSLKGTAAVVVYGELMFFDGVTADGGFVSAQWTLKNHSGIETRMASFSSLVFPGEAMRFGLRSGTVTYIKNLRGHTRILSDILISGLDHE